MTSTETRCGLTCSTRPSSRVLKPPGGGHSNIFSEPEIAVNAPRPKYNQQNSSNMNACMNSTDPNKKVEKLREEIVHSKQAQPEPESQKGNTAAAANTPTGGQANSQAGVNEPPRTRVPPGGFSSGGFW
ncbi:PREDICTED: uncharacterized protein LOC108366305 [Rhagoletis zephyria]|uniref:uncharacterized protein LOC108366305 n=1 Tax=Rhagoletis zephyria TaxID=28612 RepID=UPI00081137A5|nr:PREDICTED: uncharacterized protein LOC108366305 [Rhagoletis zephyria]XP_017476139.1 PREDICTED: uncharacterized protein LOC108366305 [Rhagoletis zephyria]XP_017476140.1 PREDICTED: uncharacterized protein LOC108366305 [Rhagoletis zephyria]XP_017476141.1 PREDICTED: uncharacterized protein LOC108366305 [Rhagoletis zephyria]